MSFNFYMPVKIFSGKGTVKSNKKEFITKLTDELDINSVPNTTVSLKNLTTEETTLLALKEFLREEKENRLLEIYEEIGV